MRTSVAICVTVVLATSGCELLTGPDLGERLVGQYDLVHVRGMSVPGWMRTCGWFACDSVYYARAVLEFQSSGHCRFLTRYWADSTLYEGGRCRWQTAGDEAEISLAGGPWKRVATNDLESGSITVVFREGCSDLVSDPCRQDWWVFRRR